MAHSIKAAISTRSQEEYRYELHKSFILDTGATGHVCNDRSRFHNFIPSTTDFVVAGNECVNIEGWGSITLFAKYEGLPEGREIILTNVALISSFHCSVISYDVLEKKGLD
jgi:hypothetical protein